MQVCEKSSVVVCMATIAVYKDIWSAVIGEELRCEREPDTNRHNRLVYMYACSHL